MTTHDFTDELAHIRDAGLLRALRTMPSVGGVLSFDGRTLLNFSSNDYLDLAADARLKEAAKKAVDEFGCGATASRLMAGHLEIHSALEERLATLVGQEAALVFPSGFQTNLGVLTTLAGREDTIYSDQLNHASIIDGARLSRARIQVYNHRDANHLDDLLNADTTSGRKIVVTDSVFSMDGDVAPVQELAEVAQRYDALLVVDEAHAIGVFGNGGGLCTECDVEADVIVGTMSKSLGSGGGFAACSAQLRELLINRARSFIFSTGLAPACAASACAAVDIIGETPDMGAELLHLARLFETLLAENGCDVMASESQIIPIMVGDNQRAVDLSKRILERDILVTAIRPPTVPAGTARLRLSITLAHTEEHLVQAAQVIGDAIDASATGG